MRRPVGRRHRSDARPATSRPIGRCKHGDINHMLDIGMTAAHKMGKREGERDAYRDLADLVDDPQELAAVVAAERLIMLTEAFLMVVVEEDMIGQYLDEVDE